MAFLAGGAFNNLDRVKAITSPTLVIHGTDDEVTPLEMGRAVYARLSGPKKLVVIEGGGHTDLTWRYADRYWSAIAAFLRDPGAADAPGGS